MKLVKVIVLLLIIGTFGLKADAAALATEQWITDPANGSKICIMFRGDGITLVSASWSGAVVDGKADGQGKLQFVYKDKAGKETKVQADAEMKAGKLDGKVSIKWSDGDAYDGDYKDGQRNGQGIFKYSSGQSYEGAWMNGMANGYGVGKTSDGKIFHEGEWKDGKPMIPLKTDKVLGIPWGASEDEGKRIMLNRAKTTFYAGNRDAKQSWQIYVSTYNDEPARVEVFYYQGKMYQVGVHIYDEVDQVLEKFNTAKKGMTERYGAPRSETGKYLDSRVYWDLGGGYAAQIKIGKNPIPQLPASWGPSQLPWRFPFAVSIIYGHPATAEIINQGSGGTSGKDY